MEFHFLIQFLKKYWSDDYSVPAQPQVPLWSSDNINFT